MQQEFLVLSIRTSLIIVCIWAAMQEGMILHWLRLLMEYGIEELPCWISLKTKILLRKPLFDCLFCMSSVWGVLFTHHYFQFSFLYVKLILTIGGINFLISLFILKHLNGINEREA